MMDISAILIQATLTFSICYALITTSLSRFELPTGMLQFHLGLLAFLSGCISAAVFFKYGRDLSWLTSCFFLWTGLSWIALARSWHNTRINAKIMTAFALTAMLLFMLLNRFSIEGGVLLWVSHFLSALVLAVTTYGMCLGHGYLNHPGLSFEPLLSMGRLLMIIVVAKAIFSVIMLVTQTVSFDWGTLPLYAILPTTNGLAVLLHFVFGVLMPLIGAYLVMGTLTVRSNQSATGILYVLMTAGLIAEGSRWVAVVRLSTAL